MPAPLTSRQEEILNFIRSSQAQNGYAPSVREIGAEFGISSPTGVMRHLKALESKGAMKRLKRNGRAVARAYTFPAAE